MTAKVKTILKYLITLVIGILLLWYFIKKQKPEDIDQAKHAFVIADYFWLGLTILISIFEKAVRAQRWNILMEPLGNKPPLTHTFNAVMVGYFANIFAPRMGEVSRCAILNRTDKIPINISFGTVVTERVIDFVCLLLLIGLSLLVSFSSISKLLSTAWAEKTGSLDSFLGNYWWILVILALVFIVVIFFIYMKRELLKKKPFFMKISEFGIGLWKGIISVKSIRRKKQFFVLTFLIWLCYFLMTYLAFLALPSTSFLGLGAGLIILVVGGLGMSLPVQAGIGAFHFFVSGTLASVYHVDKGGALSYAFLVHTSQTLTVLVLGLVCFIISSNISRKSNLSINNANL